MRSTLIDSIDGLSPYIAEWDALALEVRNPAMAPALQLAWWRDMAPVGAEPRVTVVTDGGHLVGIAPYYAQRPGHGRRDYRLFGCEVFGRVSPLAAAGGEHEVAAVMAATFADAIPRADFLTFEGVDAQSPWPSAIGGSWPGKRPWTYLMAEHPAPVLDIGGRDIETWLSSKSANFRSQMGRGRRKLEKAGAVFRCVEPAEIPHYVAEMMRLHRERWNGRGGSGLGDGVEEALAAAAEDLAPSGRLRLWVLETEEHVIAVELFISANGETAYWNGGFDEAWAAYKPAALTIYAAVEDCFARGDRRVDFGPGDQPYKLRLADTNRPMTWCGIAPRGHGYPRTRASLLEKQFIIGSRKLARRHLSSHTRQRIKQLMHP